MWQRWEGALELSRLATRYLRLVSSQAVKLLLRMPTKGVQPNAYSYNAAISACARAAEWKPALALLRRMRSSYAPAAGRVPSRKASRAPPPNTVSFNSAISACAVRHT